MDVVEELRADMTADRSTGDGAGRVVDVVAPDPLFAGQIADISVVFEVGDPGIEAGGAVVFQPSPYWGWSPPQLDWPAAPGFATVDEASTLGLELRAIGGLLVAQASSRLESGQRVTFRYRARADRFAERAPALWFGVDADGDGVRGLVPDPVQLDVLAGPVAQLIVHGPTVVRPGEPAELRIGAVDRLGNASGPIGTPELFESSGRPLSVAWKEGGPSSGAGVLSVVWTEEGVHTVAVRTDREHVGRSNPILVHADATPIFWGDLQVHTGLSDGTGVPTDVLDYARNVGGLDVVALTDHDHWGMRFLDQTPAWRDRLARATREAHDPGRFVTLHGYEWTSWVWGHRHILFFDDAFRVFSSMDERTDTPQELWTALRNLPALSIPHHPAGGPIAVDVDAAFDPEVEPVIEVVSVHGQSEHPSVPGGIYRPVQGAFVHDRLVAGARLGFVGSTDGHDGHPGLAHLGAASGGVVAFEATELTRQGIYEALRARRVYATNGPRMLLRFSADGKTMGTTLPRVGPDIEVVARVVGTAPLDRLELVGPEGVLAVAHGGQLAAHASWTVSRERARFLYVRAIQTDGGLGWSSPVFADGDSG